MHGHSVPVMDQGLPRMLCSCPQCFECLRRMPGNAISKGVVKNNQRILKMYFQDTETESGGGGKNRGEWGERE